MSSLLIGTDPQMLKHNGHLEHPENPKRLQTILDVIKTMPQFPLLSGRAATRRELARVHTEAHIDFIESLDGIFKTIDGDTQTVPDSVHSAKLAAGITLGLVDAICHGGPTRAFSLVRPPGHHAEPNRAMGFCLFSNLAVAAAHALSACAIRRVLVVDWDVHHGNGTQKAFYDRDDVYFVSVHESPLYPGSGHWEERGQNAGIGYTQNIPLPAGTGDGAYIAIFNDIIRDIAAQFRPDLVCVSAGFDAHRDDPLARMALSEDGFAVLCSIMMDIADEYAHGRICLALEGGYELGALAKSVSACIRVLSGDEPPPYETPRGFDKRVYDAALKAYRR